MVPLSCTFLGPFTEELFDQFAAYFPLDFKPSPDDLYGITVEVLSHALEECLTSTPAFAPFCLTFIEGNLTFNSEDRIIPTLKLLKVAFEKFPVSVIRPSGISLWRAISRHMVPLKNKTVENLGFQCLQLLMSTCYDGKGPPCSIEQQVVIVEQSDSLLRSVNLDRTFCVHMQVDAEPLLFHSEFDLLYPVQRILIFIAKHGRRHLSILFDHVVPRVLERCLMEEINTEMYSSLLTEWCSLWIDESKWRLDDSGTKMPFESSLSAFVLRDLQKNDATETSKCIKLSLASSLVLCNAYVYDEQELSQVCAVSRSLLYSATRNSLLWKASFKWYQTLSVRRWPFVFELLFKEVSDKDDFLKANVDFLSAVTTDPGSLYITLPYFSTALDLPISADSTALLENVVQSLKAALSVISDSPLT
ncbi:unnamed protein product, partial [Soboliphyme baturini]|uniref:MMS19 nucleotide excision repair protein n=1 Tax=Soboliphyme baturini TaxID=241478 RepID=A0A183J2X3_9BILA